MCHATNSTPILARIMEKQIGGPFLYPVHPDYTPVRRSVRCSPYWLHGPPPLLSSTFFTHLIRPTERLHVTGIGHTISYTLLTRTTTERQRSAKFNYYFFYFRYDKVHIGRQFRQPRSYPVGEVGLVASGQLSS